MKKRKWKALAGLLVLASGILGACGSQNADTKTFTYVFSSEPNTLDYSIAGMTATTSMITNSVDGLLENDKYGNIVPSLAKDWSVSADGLTYTYTLRKGIKWYTHDGQEYADVTAKDFVTGLKHAADANSAALYLTQHSIAGLDDYVTGKSKDFSTVGVKALDNQTVQYTLAQPEPFWNTKLLDSSLLPVNEKFLKAKGKDYGKIEPDGILYNGPFIMKSFTSKSSVEFIKNEHYWDADHVKINKLKFAYYDGEDQDALGRNFANGNYSTARLYPTSSNFASIEKQLKNNLYVTPQNGDTYFVSVNSDRTNYQHTAKKTEQQKADTKKAILNKNFRQALMFAFDQESFAAQINGKKFAKQALRNILPPSDFVQVNRTSFGTLVENALAEKGDLWKGIKLADGQQGLYQPQKAKEQLAKAKEELAAQGVTFPIHLDVPVDQKATIAIKQAQSYKQSIESTLGAENVVIDLQFLPTNTFDKITLFAENASQKDFDLNISNGWSPDFNDPSTYFDILDPEQGECTKDYLGFDSGTHNTATEAIGFSELGKLIEQAKKETVDLDKRYQLYAKVQAWLTDNGFMTPAMSGGGAIVVSRVKPFSSSFFYSGAKNIFVDYYKYTELQSKPVTKKEYEKAQAKWLKEKKISNQKAQEDLKNHIK